MAIPPSEKTALPAKIFRRTSISCPYCQWILDNSPSSCPRCHFHFGLLTQAMPGPGPVFESVMDFTDLLAGQTTSIEEKLNRIRKFFPQISPAVCFVTCPESVPPHQLALWLLNQATSSEDKPEWRGLLLIDPTYQQHTFSAGYALETFLPREDIEHHLDEAGRWFFEQEWQSGTTLFLDRLFETLRDSCAEALQARKKILKSSRK